ncbi:hypothetical protein PIB30_024149 [Stylosanthes scabra]|uniref:Uncharacterized protein n=1 Tax=Stylosanthes scabra TaxID=79078 RepID=A0ABU6XB68_9FABA|nr:hypothetical protein [Stylosanthes scabra]
MGVRELGFSLVILLFLLDLTSSYSTRKTLPTETLEESKIEEKRMNGSKMEGGSHAASHGGGSSAGHGNGGESGSGHSPNVPAGAGVIPVYAGGAAANNNRNHQIHRGAAANNNLSRINVFTSIVITLVCPLILFL